MHQKKVSARGEHHASWQHTNTRIREQLHSHVVYRTGINTPHRLQGHREVAHHAALRVQPPIPTCRGRSAASGNKPANLNSLQVPAVAGAALKAIPT